MVLRAVPGSAAPPPDPGACRRRPGRAHAGSPGLVGTPATEGLFRDVLEVPYRPERGRYGGAAMFTCFETFFAKEASAYLAALRTITELDDMAVAVAMLDAYARTVFDTLEERLAFVRNGDVGAERNPKSTRYLRENRAVLHALVSSSSGADHDPPAIGEGLRDLAASGERAFGALLRSVRDLGWDDLADAHREGILRSVWHMTCNRVLDHSSMTDGEVFDVWRGALQSQRGRLTHLAEASSHA
ncbi:thiopeptide-type bacteriocin biosynthesis protein [Clavibacter sepedonicus]|uniref:thiopeptide-type bacteriocin biosynthesis protein n=1 Tax=Clavibacter TaxID=1573 RepID=UPI00338FBD07